MAAGDRYQSDRDIPGDQGGASADEARGRDLEQSFGGGEDDIPQFSGVCGGEAWSAGIDQDFARGNSAARNSSDCADVGSGGYGYLGFVLAGGATEEDDVGGDGGAGGGGCAAIAGQYYSGRVGDQADGGDAVEFLENPATVYTDQSRIMPQINADRRV